MIIEYAELFSIPIFLDSEPTSDVVLAWVTASVHGVDDKGFDIREVKVRPVYGPTAWAIECWTGSVESTVPFLEKIFESLVTSSREGYFSGADA